MTIVTLACGSELAGHLFVSIDTLYMLQIYVYLAIQGEYNLQKKKKNFCCSVKCYLRIIKSYGLRNGVLFHCACGCLDRQTTGVCAQRFGSVTRRFGECTIDLAGTLRNKLAYDSVLAYISISLDEHGGRGEHAFTCLIPRPWTCRENSSGTHEDVTEGIYLSESATTFEDSDMM